MDIKINQYLLKYAEKLDNDGEYQKADNLTNGIVPNYGQMALERLHEKFGASYELPQHLSDNYDKIATTAFNYFLEDLSNLEPNLMNWFNQDDDYSDEPDIEKLQKTNKGKEMLAQYMEHGWNPQMKSKNTNFDIYAFVLRLLKRAGAEVPNIYLSEDKNFRVEQLLKNPKIMCNFINEIAKLPHETLLKLMPPQYMERASNECMDEFSAGKKLRRKKKLLF